MCDNDITSNCFFLKVTLKLIFVKCCWQSFIYIYIQFILIQFIMSIDIKVHTLTQILNSSCYILKLLSWSKQLRKYCLKEVKKN